MSQHAHHALLAIPTAAAPAGPDPATVAWLTAAGIANDSTQYDVAPYRRTGAQLWTAADAWVKGVKMAGLWDKLAAAWQFAGDTAAMHAVNVKNPGTYSLTEMGTPGGITHTGGWASPSRNGQANTGFLATSQPQDNMGVSVYLRTSPNGLEMPLGVTTAGLASGTYLLPNVSGANYYRLNSTDASPFDGQNTMGTHLAVRDGATSTRYYIRGALVNTGTPASDTPPPYAYYLGAANSAGTVMYPGSQVLGSVQLWNAALSASEAAAFTSLEQTYQAALGRDV